LPSDIMTAAKTLEACDALKQELVAEDVEYWIKSRRHEWMTFHRAGNDPDSPVPGLWEFQRYFAAS